MRRVVSLPVFLVALLSAVFFFAARQAQAASPEDMRFFEEQVRPILATKCQGCHGAEKQKGGLRLDSPDAVFSGGDSGPAIERGKPDASLLIEAINYKSLEMPPDERLPDEAVAVLTTWVKMGAPWPEHDNEKGFVRGKTTKITDEDRAYWAFQPPRSATVPRVDDQGWSRNAIDRFIFQKLAAEQLGPNEPANRRVFIRRLSFDLHGLPPTPEDVDAFLEDDSPTAYETLVERQLASPRYGERWARHWLDLVRYAESDGFKQDDFRPQAWRYRDYVVGAFNDDKPYDRFVSEQLAGDEIAPGDLDALAATAYLRHWIYEYNQRDVRTQWSNILNDVTDVTAEVFLGVSLGCARCHDHKFDPLLRKDYYRLQAFFTPLLPREDIPFATDAEVQDYHERLTAWEQKSADIRRQLADLEQPVRDRVASGAINKFPPDIRPMLNKAAANRLPLDKQIADLAFRQVAAEFEKLDFATKLKGEDKARWETLKKQLDEHAKDKPKPLASALTVTDVGPVAPATLIPGDRTKTEIAPGFLSVLDPSDALILTSHSQSTGRRTVLANWITRPENPLAARVIVNRVWQYHFGQGLVATASDFGHLGEKPSHPELLDWLTREFVDSAPDGWSLKRLHRLICTSATYQQSSASPRHAQRDPRSVDPDNRWLWRMPIRRLDAEQIRDAALTVSGELRFTAGGPSVDGSKPLRSIQTKVVRNTRDPLLDAFDAPDNFGSIAQRNVTTTPTQSLLMTNGPWLIKRAEAWAEQLQRLPVTYDAARIEQAYRSAFSRPPTAEQLQAGLAFLQQHPDPHTGLVDLCHVLLNSSEFLYVD